MIEFDYDLDYKNLDFKPNDTRYRIGRGEQGVLLVRPYTMIFVSIGSLEHQRLLKNLQDKYIICIYIIKKRKTL